MSAVQIKPEETYFLRHKVLRPHQTINDCKYPGDFDATSFHLGYQTEAVIFSVASFYKENSPEFTQNNQYRLRGMATEPSKVGQGLGSQLVKEGCRLIKDRGGDILWFNARENAFGFYLKLGFKFHGPYFEIPGIGKHKVMFLTGLINQFPLAARNG
ncbi:MAG: GNAT family N-acetyltransferase [Oligoflexia bacterium]|nr:GNAT family N-acetyltransferase [Oligoflexia bacterium]